MRILLPCIAALVPLVIAPELSFSFDVTPKVVILLVGMAMALMFWREWPGGFARKIAILLLALIAWTAAATLLSTHAGLSFAGGSWRRFGWLEQSAVLAFAVLVISDCAGRPERARTYLRAIAIGGIPIAAYGIAQHFGLDPWLSSLSYHSGEGPFTIVRPPSTLGHASYFGTYLVYVVFCGLALGLAGESKVWRVAGASAAVLAAIAMVFSGTRAALAGTALGMLVLMVGIPAFRSRRVLAGAAAVGALFIVFALSPAGAGVRSRLHWALEEPPRRRQADAVAGFGAHGARPPDRVRTRDVRRGISQVSVRCIVTRISRLPA